MRVLLVLTLAACGAEPVAVPQGADRVDAPAEDDGWRTVQVVAKSGLEPHLHSDVRIDLLVGDEVEDTVHLGSLFGVCKMTDGSGLAEQVIDCWSLRGSDHLRLEREDDTLSVLHRAGEEGVFERVHAFELGADTLLEYELERPKD